MRKTRLPKCMESRGKNSARLYQAIKGNGGTARLVLQPHESHGYVARESVLHTLAEMFEWAEMYVKKR